MGHAALIESLLDYAPHLVNVVNLSKQKPIELADPGVHTLIDPTSMEIWSKISGAPAGRSSIFEAVKSAAAQQCGMHAVNHLKYGALTLAAIIDDVDSVKILLSYQVIVAQQGHTAVIWAKWFGSQNAVRELITAGCQETVSDLDALQRLSCAKACAEGEVLSLMSLSSEGVLQAFKSQLFCGGFFKINKDLFECMQLDGLWSPRTSAAFFAVVETEPRSTPEECLQELLALEGANREEIPDSIIACGKFFVLSKIAQGCTLPPRSIFTLHVCQAAGVFNACCKAVSRSTSAAAHNLAGHFYLSLMNIPSSRGRPLFRGLLLRPDVGGMGTFLRGTPGMANSYRVGQLVSFSTFAMATYDPATALHLLKGHEGPKVLIKFRRTLTARDVSGFSPYGNLAQQAIMPPTKVRVVSLHHFAEGLIWDGVNSLTEWQNSIDWSWSHNFDEALGISQTLGFEEAALLDTVLIIVDEEP
eukprot:NODE_1440_length_1530_cov_24.408508_g1301_i0.p1 GENE.NODE_1440_length_1530_cov_24.408508_g1301_i0~~NODE_1440_length_1530_cov_24.408508_g1301_i0.p1  ORF type:complete len:489 (+),score=74.32 NODE_1440_length_1530_cov_24.408508_g1301_i0:51-1469(+)